MYSGMDRSQDTQAITDLKVAERVAKTSKVISCTSVFIVVLSGHFLQPVIASNIDIGTESPVNIQVHLLHNVWYPCINFDDIVRQLDKDTQSVLCVAICNSKGTPIG